MCDWGYCSHNGPAKWVENYAVASGSRQSPINIPETCENDSKLDSRPLAIEYETRGKMLINTGAGWKVNFDRLQKSLLEGGPLDSKYKAEQLHCHWSKDSTCGSEHVINGKSYAAEMHIVHWNCGKYASIDDAVDKPDGLAVLGIFLDVGEADHPELEKICELLPKIPHSGDHVPIETDLNPHAFLPVNKAYWTYPGSLTTPPCFESVEWIVFKEPIKVSEKQLNAFRSMLSYGRLEKVPENDEFGGKILTNYRPPLPVGSRAVRICNCGA